MPKEKESSQNLNRLKLVSKMTGIVLFNIATSIMVFVILTYVFFSSMLTEKVDFQTSLANAPTVHDALLIHFEKVSAQTMETTRWIILLIGGLVGASGILGSYFNGQKLDQTEKQIGDFNKQMKNLQEIAEGLKSELQDLKQDSNITYTQTVNAARKLQYILYARSVDPNMRKRAAQRIADVDDIEVEVILEQLLNDEDVNVREAAASGLGTFLQLRLSVLPSTPEGMSIFDNGVNILIHGTEDVHEKVRLASINSLEYLALYNILLPRRVEHRLDEITQYDTHEDVKNTAEQALDRIRNQDDSKYNGNKNGHSSE